MATSSTDPESIRALAPAPPPGRARKLWLQHAAGMILFADVRDYALRQLEASIDPATRAIAEKAIDDALYGVMMVIDGVTGAVSNETSTVALTMVVEHQQEGQPVERLALKDGDGMCMGFHSWLAGDFGEALVREEPAT